MKRKRGHKKKGKNKKQALQLPAVAAEASNNEVESGGDENSDDENSENEDGNGNVGDESKATAKVMKVATKEVVKEVEVIPPVVRPPPTVVYGRVKLKLKGMQKPPVENKVVGSGEVKNQSDVGRSDQEVVDKKGAGGGVVDDDEKVVGSGKECGAGGDKVISSRGSSGEGGKEGGGSGKECGAGGVKVVLSRGSSGEGGKEGGGGVMPEEETKGGEGVGKLVSQEGGKEVVDGNRKFGGIKFFSSKKSSQGGKGRGGIGSGFSLEGKRTEESEVKFLPREAECDKQELVDSSRKSGGIKIVSSKNSSLSGGKEIAGSGSGVSPEEEKRTEECEAKLRPREADDNKLELVDSGRKSAGIKIVSSKNSSPEGGKGSSGHGSGVLLQGEKKTEANDAKSSKKEMEDSSKKSGGIKIVSLKNSSPVSGKESDGSGLSPQEKSIEENETKHNKQELEDGSKKTGGIKTVSSINLSPSDGKESVGNVLSQEEKKTEESEAKCNKQELEDGSKKSGGIKIVSSKNSGSLGANGLSPKEKKMEENETKLPPQEANYNKQELEESSKKSGGIKIVSSRNSSPSGGKDSGGDELSPEQKKNVESEPKTLPREAKYNKQELEASLEVLQKIMKMDAAEPFNVPVDPIKLGIPDYFDVIDTPMDFGTICKNLESGNKYMDSEDVYKDVQYVWDNCYKYNNKGDYIVDLMKRVKKNFMKYWVAAGLYNEQSKNIKGEESSPLDEPTTSGQGKKLKKGKGIKRHKDDCLCAICIMKRRRREREAREAQAAREAGSQAASPHVKVSKFRLSEEYKQEDNLRTESPAADTSSYMETSPYGYVDVEMEDGEMRPDATSSHYDNEQKFEADRTELHDKSERSGDISEKSVQSDKGDAELHSHIEAKAQDDSGNRMRIDPQNPSLLVAEGQAAGYFHKRNELLELEKKRQKLRMLETFRDLENPMLLDLCGTLFPNNPQSVWSGGNSLVRCKKSCHRRDIHEAVASLVNHPCKSSSSLK